jgi:hypothetical protein
MRAPIRIEPSQQDDDAIKNIVFSFKQRGFQVWSYLLRETSGGSIPSAVARSF